MNTIPTLLVDIEHPGLKEPLRLVSGHGVSVLRTDNTGRDIYGFAHEGREYLLFPFSLAADGGNRLIMSIPAAYEEWFANMKLNGARIRFASPHGEPLFASMPKEWQSGSGVLAIDDQGLIAVTMGVAGHGPQDALFGQRIG